MGKDIKEQFLSYLSKYYKIFCLIRKIKRQTFVRINENQARKNGPRDVVSDGLFVSFSADKVNPRGAINKSANWIDEDLSLSEIKNVVEKIESLKVRLSENNLRYTSAAGMFTLNTYMHESEKRKLWENAWVAYHSGVRPEHRVLDIGGASTAFVFYLASLGCCVKVIDNDWSCCGMIYNPEKTANRRNLQIKMLVLPTKMRYNYSCQTYIAETSLLVGFVQDAKRNKKNYVLLRGSDPDSLRRNGYFSAVLSKVAAEAVLSNLCSVESPKQPVSFRGTPAEYDLYHGSWDGAHLRYPNNPVQWLLSRTVGIEKLPEAFYLEGISEGYNFHGIARYHSRPRPVAQENLEFATSFQQSHFRSGFYRSAALWLENRRGQNRIQPHQAWSPQLSAFALLRRAYPGYLAWPLASWKHSSCKRSSSALAGLSKENSQVPLPHQNSCRFGILRPQIYRAARRGKHWLRGGSQDDRAYSRKGSKPSLPYLQEKWVASSSVYLPTAQLEKAASFHRSAPPQTHMQRRRESTYALGIQGLLLSYLCYQSSLESRKCMAFLHAQSQMRIGHQRAQGKFSSGKYSYQRLLGQSGSFSFDTLGLRPRQLVQAPVFAARVEFGYSAYSAQRFVCFAGSPGSHWRKKPTQVATEVSTSKTLLPDLQKNRTSQNYIGLSKGSSLVSSITRKKYGDSPFFQDYKL